MNAEATMNKAPRGAPRCGRYWDRTSDLFRVREARYRCANRPCSVVALPARLIEEGADDETRTRDIHLGKVVLYQLSYVRRGSMAPPWAILGSNQ